VRDGRQSRRDPDAAQLIELDGAVRRYRGSDGRLFEKQLHDGIWLLTTVATL
jgi:hypothetical protein